MTTSESSGTSIDFAFVQRLAEELNRGELELPSFPDAIVKIRAALEDDECTPEGLARLAAADQVLAGRLLKLANAALLSRGDSKVRDLTSAITRLGFDMVRNAAISVAVQQVFHAKSLGPFRGIAKRLWRDSTKTAALSHALARRLTDLNADEVLLAGLLHNVGKLYILSRAKHYPRLRFDREALLRIMERWHGPIGRAIIESWDCSQEQAEAAEAYLDLKRTPRRADITDLVQVAHLLSERPREAEELATIPSCQRIDLTVDKANAIIRESNEYIRALAEALRA